MSRMFEHPKKSEATFFPPSPKQRIRSEQTATQGVTEDRKPTPPPLSKKKLGRDENRELNG